MDNRFNANHLNLKYIFVLLLAGISQTGIGQTLADTSTNHSSKNDTSTKPVSKVEMESAFPGGMAAWQRFLSQNLEYPSKAVRKKIEGTVMLQFIVDKDGSLSDMQAISGPDILKEAALKVITQSPRWIPAIQDGRKVKSYKKQPVIFKLTTP